MDEFKIDEKQDLEFHNRLKLHTNATQMIKVRQNARALEEKQKEEFLLNHEIEELKAELEKIEGKIKKKKTVSTANLLRKGARTITSKQVQERLKKKTQEIEKYKSAYKTLLHSWQDGVINKDDTHSSALYAKQNYALGSHFQSSQPGDYRLESEKNLELAYKLPNALGMRSSGMRTAHSGYKSYADKYINRIRKGSQDIDSKSRNRGNNGVSGISAYGGSRVGNGVNFNTGLTAVSSYQPSAREKARYGGIGDIQSYIQDLNAKFSLKNTSGLEKAGSQKKFTPLQSQQQGQYSSSVYGQTLTRP